MDLIFTLPNNSNETSESFQALNVLLHGDQSETVSINVIQFHVPAKNPFPAFHIVFQQNVDIQKAKFTTRGGSYLSQFGNILNDDTDPDLSLTFTEAVRRLEGLVQHLDHAGINVARETPNATWLSLVNSFTNPSDVSASIYEYPEGIDGYNSRKNLWYFALPNNVSVGTRSVNQSPSTQKFEMVHDGLSNHSVVQLDLKTNLTAEETRKLFPEGFQIEGLEDFFYSVLVKTPWVGMHTLRLDLRFQSDSITAKTFRDKTRAAFENGSFFTKGPWDPDKTENPERLSPVQSLKQQQARLPAFAPHPQHQ